MLRNLIRVMFPVFVAATLFAQEPPPEPTDTPTPTATAALPNLPGLRGAASDPQPYEKVITKDAKSAKGIFTVHQVKDRYYYEIPKDEFDKAFLLNVRRIASVRSLSAKSYWPSAMYAVAR